MSKIQLTQLSIVSNQKLVEVQTQEQKVVIAAGIAGASYGIEIGIAGGLALGAAVDYDNKWKYAAAGGILLGTAGALSPF